MMELFAGGGAESMCWSRRNEGRGRAGKGKRRRQSLPLLLFMLDRQELIGSGIMFSPWEALGQPWGFA